MQKKEQGGGHRAASTGGVPDGDHIFGTEGTDRTSTRIKHQRGKKAKGMEEHCGWAVSLEIITTNNLWTKANERRVYETRREGARRDNHVDVDRRPSDSVYEDARSTNKKDGIRTVEQSGAGAG